jgi:predicted O-linked N-acetylglucosamine transferase (SPINDLY family)
VARDEDDYARIAAALAADLLRLAALRRRLRPAMAESPVCDTRRFARDFCAVLKSIA